ncbi:MAG: 6-phosphogluconolactonase [Pseudomonadota bacterium]
MVLEVATDRLEASETAARHLHAAVVNDIAENHRASLVLSGGSTPLECYRHLGNLEVPWRNVAITLSDERWVPPSDSQSNAGMLAQSLFVNDAANATFVPLWTDKPMPEDALTEIATAIDEQLPRPFSAVLLGMGSDGHFASLFPDAENLANGLDLNTPAICLAARTAASPVPRISLTLATLINCRELVLLIFGTEKRAVLEAAAAGESELPIAALLTQDSKPVRVIWAP